ncbi:hypothetical protein ACFODN_12830, partial [Rodentibacter caecimuris]|uniref:hypothetical protein n=1 Tax=Rodentibacter caecimuris TaxID=1796644 RepID=UPI00360A2846
LLRGAAFALALGVTAGLLPPDAAAEDLPFAVPAGTKLVVTDDANRFETLFNLSGEREKLAADVTFVNFSSGPIGLEAIRAGARPTEPDNVVQPLGTNHMALYASADYLDRMGRPAGIGDLDGHRFIGADTRESRAPFYRWLAETQPAEAEKPAATPAETSEPPPAQSEGS